MKNGTKLEKATKFAVGNNENENMDYQNQYYFYFNFQSFGVGQARKTTNQIGLALGMSEFLGTPSSEFQNFVRAWISGRSQSNGIDD